MNTFRHIGHRLLFAVGSVVAIGMVAVVLLYAQRQERSILDQNERALAQVTDSAVEGLRAIMLRGYAEISHDYAARLAHVDDVIDYRFLRMDGSEAFIDNLTIEAVNARLGRQAFVPRPDPPPAMRIIDRSDRRLAVMSARGDHVVFYETRGGERMVTIFEPIPDAPECRQCHGNEQRLRGLVKLTTSLKAVDADIAATWRLSTLVIVTGLAAIFGVVWMVAQRTVVRPIRTVTDAMAKAALGDLKVSVPVTGGDEIGAMAGSFNRMSEELQRLYSGLSDEQNKLTTIILGSGEGIVVTDAQRNIVLINPAAVELLGKSEDELVAGGFANLIDDPEWIEWRLGAGGEGAAPGVVEYRGRMLLIQASTTRSASGAITGSTAIIRDVTEEKRLESELKRASITDALTGLYNRRHFDASLADEFRRWARYRGAYSVAMLDVDHFKRFNDTHGHDCGDRVLQAIGGVLRAIADKNVIACRYGGEELVLILPDYDQQRAVGLADDIRRTVEGLVIDGLQVTVSVGVAGSPPHKCSDPEAILKLADGALYAAKEGGRNRVAGATAA